MSASLVLSKQGAWGLFDACFAFNAEVCWRGAVAGVISRAKGGHPRKPAPSSFKTRIFSSGRRWARHQKGVGVQGGDEKLGCGRRRSARRGAGEYLWSAERVGVPGTSGAAGVWFVGECNAYLEPVLWLLHTHARGRLPPSGASGPLLAFRNSLASELSPTPETTLPPRHSAGAAVAAVAADISKTQNELTPHPAPLVPGGFRRIRHACSRRRWR